MINVNRDKKQRRIEPKDLFPSLQPPRRIQTSDQQRNTLLALAKVSGARIVRVPREQLEEMAGWPM